MRNTKSAFTLVELIVVITILAILGTIAFISLQGYSAEARNSKRTTDLSSITTALNVKITDGLDIMAAISDSTNGLDGIKIGGSGSVSTGTTYDAGTVNYTVLGMKMGDFQDPLTEDSYVLGATTYAGGVYELAASMEDDAGKKAAIRGTYNPRTGTNATAAIDAVSMANGSKVKLDNSENIGKFKVNDYVTVNDGSSDKPTTIRSISKDGMTITVNETLLDSTSATIALRTTEDAGLILAHDGNDASGLVTQDGTNLPY